MAINNDKKYSTGIDGLDSLLYGGIHLELDGNQGAPVNSDGGLLILNRGKHGVNKVHLAMQMCEGLQLSMKEKTQERRSMEGVFGNKGEEKRIKDIDLEMGRLLEKITNTNSDFIAQKLEERMLSLEEEKNNLK